MGFEPGEAIYKEITQKPIWKNLPKVEDLPDPSGFSSVDGISLSFESEGHAFDLNLRYTSLNTDADLCLGIDIGNEIGSVFYNKDTITTLFHIVGQDISIVDALSVETHAIVMEYLFSTLLDQISNSLGDAVKICPVISIRTAPTELQILIDKETEISVWLDLPTSTLRRIASIFVQPISDVNVNTPVDHTLQMHVGLYGPTINLNEDAFIELALGDAIVFPHQRGQPLVQYVALGRTPLATVEIRENHYVICAHIKKKRKRKSSEMVISGIDSEVDDMTVEIHLELFSKMFKLGDIRQFDVGTILPFGNKVPKKVRLFVGDSCFAEGELVQFEENIAVRITSFKG